MFRDIFNRAGLKKVNVEHRYPYEKVWDFATICIIVAIVAGFCWFAGAISQFVFPEKWTSIVGPITFIKTVGKWVFWISTGLALLCYIAGWIVPFFTKDQGDTYHELHDDGSPRIRRRP